MKNINRILGLALLVFIITTASGFAQGKSQEKRNAKVKASKEKVQEIREDANDEIEIKEEKSRKFPKKGKNKVKEIKEQN